MQATGPVSVPKEKLRQHLAASPSFRAQLEVELPDAALPRIHVNRALALPGVSAHAGQRPYAIVATEACEEHQVAGGSQNYLRPRGTLWLYLCDRQRYPADQANLEAVAFENWVGAVMSDLKAQAGADENLSIIGWSFEVPPVYFHPTLAGQIGEAEAWSECALFVDWE